MLLTYDNGQKILNTKFIEKFFFVKDAEKNGFTVVHMLSISGERSVLSLANDKVDAFKAKVCCDIDNVNIEGL